MYRKNAHLDSSRAKYRIKFDFQLSYELCYGFQFQPHVISKTESHQPKSNELVCWWKKHFYNIKNCLSVLDVAFESLIQTDTNLNGKGLL